jgi:predicted dehydrogenase
MKAVLIGLGMVADMHALSCRDSAQVTLHGVCARREGSAARYAARLSDDFGMEVKTYRNVAEVAADPEVDFVIFATPPSTRLEPLKTLVAAGKPILLEKPVARTLDEAKEVVALCAGRVPLGLVFQHRMREASIALAAKLPSLGALQSANVSVPWWRPQSYYDEPGRGTYAQDGGGVLLTQAIHTLNLMLSLTGPVSRVQAMTRTTKTHDMEAEDFVAAGLEFANGAVGALQATTANFPGAPETITLNCANGSAVLARGALALHWRDGRQEQIGAQAGSGGGANPMAFSHGWHQGVIEDFVAALREDRAPLVTGQEALQVHALIDALTRSSAAGAMVEVSDV